MFPSPPLPIYLQQNTLKEFSIFIVANISSLFHSLTLSSQAFMFSILPELLVQVTHDCHVTEELKYLLKE